MHPEGQDFIVCRQYHLISEQILWQELMSVRFIRQMKMFCLLISERMERLYFQIMEDCTCSCAAGPALEGMNISSGMRAAEGAIEDVEIKEDGVKLKIIGNAKSPSVSVGGILMVKGW